MSDHRTAFVMRDAYGRCSQCGGPFTDGAEHISTCRYAEPSSVGSPAHTSVSESPDSSPDCPRCAALTRERNETRGEAKALRSLLEAERAKIAAFEADAETDDWLSHRLRVEWERADTAERDLAQARQALREIAEPRNLYGDVLQPHHVKARDLRAIAREALVERGTEKTDTGDEPRSSCAGEPRELVCQICGVEHGVWFAPSAIWNAVCREGDRGNPDKWSFLCPVCFMREGDKLGLAPTGWFLTPEPWDDDKRRALGLPVEEPAHVSGCELPTPAPVSLSVQEGQGETLGASRARRAQERQA